MNVSKYYPATITESQDPHRVEYSVPLYLVPILLLQLGETNKERLIPIKLER